MTNKLLSLQIDLQQNDLSNSDIILHIDLSGGTWRKKSTPVSLSVCQAAIVLILQFKTEMSGIMSYDHNGICGSL